MSHDFKLGPSILKAEDSPHLPDLWLSSLLHKHLDGPARAAFAQSNKAALNLLLSEWPQAALTLRVQAFATDPPERLVRRMHAAQQQIAARGSKQTLLAVKQHGAIPEGGVRTGGASSAPSCVRGLGKSPRTVFACYAATVCPGVLVRRR